MYTVWMTARSSLLRTDPCSGRQPLPTHQRCDHQLWRRRCSYRPISAVSSPAQGTASLQEAATTLDSALVSPGIACSTIMMTCSAAMRCTVCSTAPRALIYTERAARDIQQHGQHNDCVCKTGGWHRERSCCPTKSRGAPRRRRLAGLRKGTPGASACRVQRGC